MKRITVVLIVAIVAFARACNSVFRRTSGDIDR